MEEYKTKTGGRIVIGGFILLMGVAFLLSNFDLIDFNIPQFIFSWPTILIVIGTIIIINSNDVAGYILASFGILFLLGKYYDFNVWDFWPVLLIIMGLYILLNVHKRPSSCSKSYKANGGKGVEINDNMIDEIAIFGGGKKYINSKNFLGGKTTAIFGGIELDLLDAQLAPGEQTIDMLAIFGGVSFFLPRDWKVVVKLTPIFGGFSDERKRNPNFLDSTDKVLIIKGLVLFGGGEIKGG